MTGETTRIIEYIKTQFTPKACRRLVPGNQLALYVMAGGGMIGRMYAQQPADAYRDTRAGRAPYAGRKVERMRLILVALAERAGLDPRNLPAMSDFHGAGVF